MHNLGERESVRMASDKCAGCGRELSASALFCPGCKRPNIPKPSLSGRKMELLTTIAIAALLFPSINEHFGAFLPGSMPSRAKPSFSVTASEIAVAYNADKVAADMKFKGQRFSVTGIVDDFGVDLFDNPCVKLRGGGNPLEDPQFEVDASFRSNLSLFRIGMEATFVCTGNGDLAKVPASNDCSFAEVN